MIGDEMETDCPIDRAGCLLSPARDRDVLQSAESAEQHLPEQRQRVEVALRKLDGERRPGDNTVVQNGPGRKKNKHCEDDQDRNPADVVNPLPDLETAECGKGDCDQDHGDDRNRGEMVLRQPGSGRAEKVREFGGDGVENGGGHGDPVDPQIPRGKKADEVPERFARPRVKAALERNGTVQINNGGRHGKVKQQHGGNPGDRLRAPKARSHTNPCTAHDAENLGQDKIAQTELAAKVMLGVRGSVSSMRHTDEYFHRASGVASGKCRRGPGTGQATAMRV